jgi:predicted methyltransferase
MNRHFGRSRLGILVSLSMLAGAPHRLGQAQARRRTIRPSSPRPTAAMPTGKPTSAASPAKMLAFTGVKTGMKVLDMEAGAGYSTELLARAVGAPAWSTRRIRPR